MGLLLVLLLLLLLLLLYGKRQNVRYWRLVAHSSLDVGS
jgi:hypothetical protein